jgi:hypothetical protein
MTSIFGPKKDKVRGEWRRLYNEEFNHLCSSPNIILVIIPRTMKSMEHVACMGERSAYRILVGRPEARRTLGRPRHIWENNINVDLHEKVNTGSTAGH